MLHFLYNIFQKYQFLERILLYINKVSLYTLNTYVFIKACKLDNNITNRYKFNSTTQNSSNINFKQKLPKKAEKVISEEALTVASAAATALGIATISLSKNNNEVKKFDHEALAVLIREKISQGKQHKQICEELGISSSVYCKVIKEFNIETPRLKTRQNRKDINLEEFKKDIAEGLPKVEILAKYDITAGQYWLLIKKHNIQTKRMLDNSKTNSITKEDFINAIETSRNKSEVCRKLKITDKTYARLKANFGVNQDPANEHEEWDYLTTSEKEALLNSGRSLKDICEEYHVTKAKIRMDCRAEGIKTKNVIAREKLEKVDLKQIQADVDAGLSIDEILSKHNISMSQYQTLIDRRKITTTQSRARDKVNNITLEQFQEVLNTAQNTKEAMAMLGDISKGTFHNLLQKFNIDAPWMKKRQKKEFPVSKEALEADVKAKLTVNQICQKYSIAQNMYYNMVKAYNIKTPHAAPDSMTSQLSTEELQEKINEKKYHKDVYKELGLTRRQYANLLRNRGLTTKHQEAYARTSKITKDELLDLILNGATVTDICKKYSLTPTNCYLLLKQHSINWNVNGFKIKNTDLEKMPLDTLKDSLANLLLNNENIAENDELSDLIDFVYNLDITTNQQKNDLVNFVKIIKNVENKNISAEDALQRDEVQTFNDIYNDKLAFVDEYKNMIEALQKENEADILNICLKYIPSLDSDNKEAKVVLDLISNIQDKQKLKQSLIYQDAKFSNSANLSDAENFAKDTNDKIDTAKAGEYIIASNDLEQGSSDEVLNDFIENIKNDKTNQNVAVKTVIKLKNLLAENDLKALSLTDFLKVFSLDDADSKSIIKKFVEDYYIKNDTTVIATNDKGREEPATFAIKAKKAIYSKYKGTKGIEVLSLFDEALYHIVATDGQAGIKFFSKGGIKYPRLKIMGYPDRINSSKQDLVFDEYSSDGGHK